MFDAVRRWSFECLYSRVGEPAIQGGRPRRIQMGVKPYCLTLLGPSGTGKTHLCKQAMACVNSIKTRAGDTYKTIHWPTLFADMKEEEDFGKYHYYCKNYGHLFIDELCKVSAGNFDITQVGTGMESRLKKWTLITANLSMEEIAVDLDPRIASRMSGRGNLYLQLSEDTPDFG